jgi:hypothetical protein
VCPACRRWYRVGEKGFKEFNSFQEFLKRPTLRVPEVPLIISALQDVRIKQISPWVLTDAAIETGYLHQRLLYG